VELFFPKKNYKNQLECTVRSRMEYLVDHYAVIQSHSS